MAKKTPHILMVAAENGALVGGKVGGVADVVRDLPRALAAQGLKVTVVTPNYGFLNEQNPAKAAGGVEFPFCGRTEYAEIHEVKPKGTPKNVKHVVLENIWMRGAPIYFNDPPWRAFAADASKYAMLCSAVGRAVVEGVGPFKGVDVIHLHDWHAATLALLRDVHPAFDGLRGIRTVYTIHNLAIQGTRPVEDHESSLGAWFPELMLDSALRSRVYSDFADYRYGHPSYCPMLVGIRHADAVTTVSPTYAREIQQPSDPDSGFFGGEGLEYWIRQADGDGRLFGIINGVEYPDDYKPPRLTFAKLREKIEKETAALLEADPANDKLKAAMERVAAWKGRKAKVIVTAVSRVADQKTRLLFENATDGANGFDRVMEQITAAGGVFILLGKGIEGMEAHLLALMSRHENFLFINGTSIEIANRLIAGGQLFLMPSLFEPCGIGQMLAMRDGQPPLVHSVGGLADTVKDGEDGFAFTGAGIHGKVDGMLETLDRALTCIAKDKKTYKAICETAASRRFDWAGSAAAYKADVYGV
ncbi:MAG: glycogen/starch synthase [Deltaproteobacteria bacterium]|nr:glycogen/starch synthase [Deltaproteobacteria bacterium]MCB9479587.1 glycogen/starch synthase [Deltaproteobacteria bacterium]MCB9488823.1 glycogen/starch synthase [Deltaproteobacteria bacterium]